MNRSFARKKNPTAITHTFDQKLDVSITSAREVENGFECSGLGGSLCAQSEKLMNKVA